MSEKSKLAKEIHALEKEIEGLENKRSRSQASILQAMVTGAEQNSDDVLYFNTFTEEIDVKRERLKILKRQYDNII